MPSEVVPAAGFSVTPDGTLLVFAFGRRVAISVTGPAALRRLRGKAAEALRRTLKTPPRPPQRRRIKP